MSNETYEQLTKENTNPLRYECFQPEIRHYISTIEKHADVCKHINDLYELIAYQMKQITIKEAFIISQKHKEAWKHYEQNYKDWDSKNRRFFTEEELKSRKC